MEIDDFQIENRCVRVATDRKSQTINICLPGRQPQDEEEYEQVWRIRRPDAPLTPRQYQAVTTIEALVNLVQRAGGVGEV
jgi:hypothetical protein